MRHSFFYFLESGEIAFLEEKGFIIIFNEGSIFLPARVFNFLQKKLIETLGLEEASKILKLVGRFQADQALKRYVKTLGINSIEKEKIENFLLQIAEAIGIGKLEISKYENNIIEVTTQMTVLSYEAKLEYGVQKHVWDYYVSGLVERAAELLYNKKFNCEEIECYAKGDERCSFVCKALE